MYTKIQQAEHCERLANILEEVPNKQYMHDVYWSDSYGCGTVACALGWAATHRIGGLFHNPNHCKTPDLIDCHGKSIGPERGAEVVFGHDAYREIFSTGRFHLNQLDPNLKIHTFDGYTNGRVDSIRLLRLQAAMLRAEREAQLTAEGDRHRSTYIA